MSKYTISTRTYSFEGDTNSDGCIDVTKDDSQFSGATFPFADAKERKVAMKRAKAYVEWAHSKDLERAGTLIWHPPVKCSDELLKTAHEKVCTWHGIYDCVIDRGAITARDWPRSETGRSSLRAYLEGLDDALRACAL